MWNLIIRFTDFIQQVQYKIPVLLRQIIAVYNRIFPSNIYVYYRPFFMRKHDNVKLLPFLRHKYLAVVING